MNNPSLYLVLIDDNPADARLLHEAFSEADLDVCVEHFDDAEWALDLLRHRDPDAVVLDLNMPGFDGRAFLRSIRSDPDLAEIEVIVLTSSYDDRDMRTCEQLGVHAYLRKPTDFEAMIATAREIAEIAQHHVPSQT